MEQSPSSPVLAAVPAVLLTKGQFSNLYRQLKIFLRDGKGAFLCGWGALFGQIRSATAQMSRSPQQFSLYPDQNLAGNGLLDEVLDGLPYKSTASGLTQKIWECIATDERDDLLRRLQVSWPVRRAYDKDANYY